MTLLEVAECGSTNTELSRMALEGARHGTVLMARAQSAGRGQRGNSWEAAPGANITLSMLLMPEGMRPAQQFRLSEAVAVGIAEWLQTLLPGEDVGVKWPNDIYVGDRKICGILIENTITSERLIRSVAGIGVNVNQREFLSDAPNPVSLQMLTGRTYDVGALARDMCTRILGLLDADAAELHGRYLSLLWRRSGYHRWRDCLRGEEIEAAIADVAPDGLFTLRLRGGQERSYRFKEVAAIL